MENSKKYRFLEALDKIVGTNRKFKNVDKGNFWFTYDAANNNLLTAEGHEIERWPTLEEQKAQIWEIEPGELYLWVEYNEENNSWLCSYSPPGDNLTIDQERDSFEQSGLFSKKKMQKFKLVPVED